MKVGCSFGLYLKVPHTLKLMDPQKGSGTEQRKHFFPAFVSQNQDLLYVCLHTTAPDIDSTELFTLTTLSCPKCILPLSLSPSPPLSLSPSLPLFLPPSLPPSISLSLSLSLSSQMTLTA